MGSKWSAYTAWNNTVSGAKRVLSSTLIALSVAGSVTYKATIGDFFQHTTLQAALYGAGIWGDDTEHLLTAGEAEEFNTLYGDDGLVVDTTWEWDTAAIMACLLHAAATGKEVQLPEGVMRINKPLTLSWDGTDNPLVSKIYGCGYATVLKGYNIASGRGILELLGTDNGNAVNCEVAHLRLYADTSCSSGSYCGRFGDAWTGLHCHRVSFEGPNCVSLKVASSLSYANLNTRFTQCRMMANYGYGWWADNSLATCEALHVETGGSYWDNVLFDSCIFGNGVADVRAFVVTFINCQFYNDPRRANQYGYNIFCTLGSLNVFGCYFEDHSIAIVAAPFIANLGTISIRDSHFSGVTNFPSPAACQRAISVTSAENGTPGFVTIENNRINSTGYADDSIFLQGVLYRVSGNVHLYHNGDPLTIDRQFSYGSYDTADSDGTGVSVDNSLAYRESDFNEDRFRQIIMTESADDSIYSVSGGIEMANVKGFQLTAKRRGTGIANGEFWGHAVQRADAQDVMFEGWASTTYLTGGAFLWALNDQPFKYLPAGAIYRIGWGASADTYHEFEEDDTKFSDGILINRQQDLDLVKNVPHWVKGATQNFNVFWNQQGGASATTTIGEIPAGCVITAVMLRPTQQWDDNPSGAIAGVTVKLGTQANGDEVMSDFSGLFDAPSGINFHLENKASCGSMTAPWNVWCTIDAGIALTNLTRGSFDVYFLVSKRFDP